MAMFNIGIDCPSEDAAQALHDFIAGLEIFQDELDVDEDRVSLVSQQGLLEELKAYAGKNNVALSLEVWPQSMDYDEADEGGDLEFFSYK